MLSLLYKGPDHISSTNANFQDLLKVFALALMIIDHIGAYFYPDENILRIIGRLCVPIWFFFVGYNLDKNNYKSSTFNLLLIGLAMEAITTFLGKPFFSFNILVSMAVARYIIVFLDGRFEVEKNLIMTFLGVVIWYFAATWVISYGAIGVILAYLGYAAKNKDVDEKTRIIMYVATFFLFVSLQSFAFGFVGKEVSMLSFFSTIIFFFLYSYKHSELPNNMLLKMISRNSLLIYFVHLPIFTYFSSKYETGQISLF